MSFVAALAEEFLFTVPTDVYRHEKFSWRPGCPGHLASWVEDEMVAPEFLGNRSTALGIRFRAKGECEFRNCRPPSETSQKWLRKDFC